MATGYVVTGRGDLDALFKPRTSAAAAATGYKSNGGVDLAQRFEPRGASAAIADTGYKVSATDLAQIFMTIAAGSITLANLTLEADSVAPANAGAQYTLESDGDIIGQLNASSADYGDWINPKTMAPGAYEVRATLVSGVAPTSGTMNTWLALTANRGWTLTRSALGISTSVILIEIRLGGTTLGSCQVTLIADKGG